MATQDTPSYTLVVVVVVVVVAVVAVVAVVGVVGVVVVVVVDYNFRFLCWWNKTYADWD